jgi:hypothetical protein
MARSRIVSTCDHHVELKIYRELT